eukprot:6834773-Alexandrium_andersonii.AAC.1
MVARQFVAAHRLPEDDYERAVQHMIRWNIKQHLNAQGSRALAASSTPRTCGTTTGTSSQLCASIRTAAPRSSGTPECIPHSCEHALRPAVASHLACSCFPSLGRLRCAVTSGH